MYDKLGSLISETLEAGSVQFIRIESNENEKHSSHKEEDTVHSLNNNDGSEKLSEQLHQTVQPESSGNEKQKKDSVSKKIYVYKKLTPELKHAYKVLDISINATKEDVRKAYKEKLLYYHPDKHSGNKIIEKVATKKTSEIILAYNLIEDFLNT